MNMLLCTISPRATYSSLIDLNKRTLITKRVEQGVEKESCIHCKPQSSITSNKGSSHAISVTHTIIKLSIMFEIIGKIAKRW